MENIGIWLDGNIAYIIANKHIKEVPSNIEHFHPKGGSGTRFKGGPQDVVQDSKYLERNKQQLKKYFASIVDFIKTNATLVIFGPAEIKHKFKKELDENYKDLSDRVVAVETTDSMTRNQLIQWVAEFYNN
ncbi:hypothetical protein [uncultured Winogradskyella sp.]|uniref:hypothetical protein n=1 Tax=uncultured Winogradskyella sp. TaxID=395353 RepID=UPI00260B7EEE|nr:hypothetical protein [uncultured Winogradskyella sp.]